MKRECREGLPESLCSCRLWTDEDNYNLIKDHYAWFLDTYVALPKPVMKADASRYLYMYHMGGDLSNSQAASTLLHHHASLSATHVDGCQYENCFNHAGWNTLSLGMGVDRLLGMVKLSRERQADVACQMPVMITSWLRARDFCRGLCRPGL